MATRHIHGTSTHMQAKCSSASNFKIFLKREWERVWSWDKTLALASIWARWWESLLHLYLYRLLWGLFLFLSQGKLSEVPYIQVFMAFFWDKGQLMKNQERSPLISWMSLICSQTCFEADLQSSTPSPYFPIYPGYQGKGYSALGGIP